MSFQVLCILACGARGLGCRMILFLRTTALSLLGAQVLGPSSHTCVKRGSAVVPSPSRSLFVPRDRVFGARSLKADDRLGCFLPGPVAATTQHNATQVPGDADGEKSGARKVKAHDQLGRFLSFKMPGPVTDSKSVGNQAQS